MGNYTKLSCDIIFSSIWEENSDFCKLWVTLMAMSDRDGVVSATPSGIARCTATLSAEYVEAALRKLMGPDPQSRNPDNGGRRIEKIDGGYRLLNFEIYRDMSSPDEMRAKATERMRRYRDRQKKKETKNSEMADTQKAFPGSKEMEKKCRDLAIEWMDKLDRYANSQALAEKDLPIWIKSIYDITKLDKVQWNDVVKIVKWVYSDRETAPVSARRWRGWFYAIQSPMKLRKKNGDGIQYHQVILERANLRERRYFDKSMLSDPESSDWDLPDGETCRYSDLNAEDKK